MGALDCLPKAEEKRRKGEKGERNELLHQRLLEGEAARASPVGRSAGPSRPRLSTDDALYRHRWCPLPKSNR